MATHWSRTHILLAVLTVVTLPTLCQNRWCYSCHLEPGRNVCSDAGILLQERQRYNDSLRDRTGDQPQNFRSDLIVDCGQNNRVCVVETIIDGDKSVKMMYRDCSDGKQFSTNVSGTRLEGIEHDNNTHCAYQQYIQATVCISVCDSDLCNGPQFSKAVVTGWSQFLVLAMSAIAVLLKSMA